MERTEIRTPEMMDCDKYSGHTSARCLFPDGGKPAPATLHTPVGRTPDKSASITPFSVSDIIRPSESPTGSTSMDDSCSDSLHIDLDARPALQDDASPATDDTAREADDMAREADDIAREADDIAREADDRTADDREASRLNGVKRDDVKLEPASSYPHAHHPFHFPGYHMTPGYQPFIPHFPPAMFPGGMLPFSPYYASVPPAPMHAYPSIHAPSDDVTEDIGVLASSPVSPSTDGRVSPSDSLSSSSVCSSNTTTSPTTSSDATTADSNLDASNSRRRAPGVRTCYNPKQVRAMEKVFLRNRYPDYEVFEAMSDEIGIPTKKIKVWFQNKRARSKFRFPEMPHAMMPPGYGYAAAPYMTPLVFPPRPSMPMYQGYPYPLFPSLVA